MNSVQHLAHLLQQLHDGPAPALVAYLEVSISYHTVIIMAVSHRFRSISQFFWVSLQRKMVTSRVVLYACSQPVVLKHIMELLICVEA